ncbi:MAG: hypothetical protein L6R39_005609 [Caloplaca ligustica]|nr:MAG: hypothetical protein L6R39_005609 [Caloplaca ligustica]
MSVPHFASAFRQSYSGAAAKLQHKLLGKRKRRAELAVIADPDDPDVPSHEDTHSHDSTVGEAPSPGSSTGSTGLRQQHYAVLTSLLHRCILERDYARASRAWAMLLRTELGGHPLDIRAQERWGIGAELLLHTDTTPMGRAPDMAGQPFLQDQALPANAAKSTLEGLARAMHYYERLILQFPYRKTAPDATSSLTFYPLMFGVWIHSIQLRYKMAMQESLQALKISRSRGSSDDMSSDEPSSDTTSARSQLHGGVAARQTAVQDANAVVERLNELLTSPPYSDHSGLWKIKGMLLLWIGHLLDYNSLSARSSDSSGDESVSTAPGGGKPESSLEERQMTILRAQDAFSRALALGDTLDARIREEVGL